MRRAVIVIVLTALVSACGSSGSDIVNDNEPESGAAVTATKATSLNPTESKADSPSPATAAPDESEAADTETPTVVHTTPTVAISPTPKPSPTAEQVALSVTSQGFGQGDGEREVGWAFLIENPNTGLAFERTEYQLAILDATGTILETDSGYINLLLPGEHTAIAGTVYLPEGATANSIDVSINEGDAEPLDITTTFTTEKATYFSSEYFQKVSGIVKNPYNRDLEDVRLSAVAYDANGAIIGGGFTFLNFIPAQDQAGAMVSVSTSGEPARVELFAAISGLTLLSDSSDDNSDLQPLVLASQGFGQDSDSTEIGWGFVVENPNQNLGIETSKYNVVAYDESGTVIGTEGGYINLLLPDETLGFGGSIYLAEGTVAASITVQVLAGESADVESETMFSTENVAYVADEYVPKSTGSVVNLTDKTLEDIRVSAVAYNDAGEIVGGGFTYIDFVPAQGKTAVEVSVTTSSAPSRVELYPTVTSLTFLSQ